MTWLLVVALGIAILLVLAALAVEVSGYFRQARDG
jgi:hypothetical protein